MHLEEVMSEVMAENPVYLLMALIGTALYLLKLVLLLVSGDSAEDLPDSDVGDSGLHHTDGGATFSLVSTQSVLAFFMGTGWVGLATNREWNMENPQAILISSAFGFLMMLLSAFLTFKIKSLNTETEVNLKEAEGKSGRAYTNIPAKGEGMGQVEITVGGKQQILQAMSTGDAIKSFDSVLVVKVDDSGNLIVKKN